MPSQTSWIDDYIHAYPRQSLQIAFLGLCLFWQSGVAVLGVLAYWLLVRGLKLKWWVVLSLGMVMAASAIYFKQHAMDSFIDLSAFFREGFLINLDLWRSVAAGDVNEVLYYLYPAGQSYLLGFPLLVVGILGVIDLVNVNPHQLTMKALHKKQLSTTKEISEDRATQL